MGMARAVNAVQGHRGYGDLAPHNSLAAFKKAAADPAVQSVEFDVRGTADGHLVVTHGPEIGKALEDASLAELQAVDLGGGERVPLLADVIDTCLQGGLVMNVEIKAGGSRDKTLKTLAMLRSKHALPHCQISSFDRTVLKVVLEQAPEVPIGAIFCPSTGRVDPSDASSTVLYENYPEDFASWFGHHKVEGDSVNVRAEALLRDASLVQKARAAGKKVLAWFPGTPNPGYEDGESTYERLLDLGVDVLCCNRPDILADLLKRRQSAAADSATANKEDGAPAAKRSRTT